MILPLDLSNRIVDEVLTHIILTGFITGHVFEVGREINRHDVPATYSTQLD